MKPAVALTTFDRTPETDTLFATILTVLHGRATQFSKKPLDL